MSGFDIAVLLVVGFGAVTGFWRGFVHEILTLASWIAAVAAIRAFHAPLTKILIPPVHNESGAGVLAFGLLLIVPYALVKVVARWAGGRSRASVLAPFDRLLGLGFGALKGMIIIVLVFSVVMLGYDTIWGPAGRPEWVTHARSYRFVNASSNGLLTILAERRRAALEAEARASPEPVPDPSDEGA